ncbi:uncharacterized protein LY79DRAFT_557093 [Colletotrichum navitas]|uniref:Uncharacterized protein n=1 Tax=Colletotrichum navitas TaxID=681940 RepID=A0AAD8V3U7_9PEZI|nr:uncharacterized protein LY79DRAFT_557093 [Colletotrichum navitas]KAK1586192.1 hypothetical protein LY79DRAFT_557093 [Colletotrichum navitas]
MSKAEHAATAYRDGAMDGSPMPLTASAPRAAEISKRSNSSSRRDIRVENEYRQPAPHSMMADVAIGPRSDIRRNQQRPGLRIRRFGRSDFERFNEEAAVGSHLLLGSSSIGKVEIECNYRWRKARWGVLGPNQNPAGIVYIDISFKQPPEHMLSNANILITLSEDAPSSLGRFSRRKPIRTSLDSEHAVQVTEYFGPHAIYGPQGMSLETKERTFQPTIGAGGMVELGGMGTRQSVTRQYVDSWTFKGTQKRAKDGIGLRCLEWELTENDTEKKPLHNHVFHTAFAFEHSGKPVNMCVEIGGRLKSKTKQGKQRLFRFRSRSGDKDNNVMVTQIDLSTARNDFQDKLDQLAFGLNLDMQRINLEAIPVEMPVPTQATFEPVASDARSYADEAILNSIEESPGDDINELKEFLLQETTRPPAFKISQPVCSGNSSSGDETLVNDSDHTVSGGSTASKQIAWRIPEVMILALVRWLMLMLKAIGTDDVYLTGMPVSTDEGGKTTADRDIMIDRVKSEIRSRSGPRMESVLNRRLLDAAATQSVSKGHLVPEPYGSHFQGHQRRLSHVRVSGQDAASMELRGNKNRCSN